MVLAQRIGQEALRLIFTRDRKRPRSILGLSLFRALRLVPEAFGTRLKAATDYVNDHYNLDSLQKELPERLVMLSNQRGGRIGK